MDKAPSAVEQAKAASQYLRGTLLEELASDADAFSKGATTVLKFHGIYQQEDRDLRKQNVHHIGAMVRVGVPGGRLTAEQWLTLDRLADLGDGSLRITTRQDIQYHYVPKADLRQLVRELNGSYLSTLAACGDVVRNVTSCPAPFVNDQRRDIQPYVLLLSRELKPRSTAYAEVWIDGEKAVSLEEAEEVEPLYGKTYLPRKFKIGFAYPGDNTTDVYSNDIGIVPRFHDGAVAGFTVLAGGGMGQSAGVKDSHPRLADPVCDVGADPQELLAVAKAIVSIHRDFGNRSNRKLARLKYVLDAWGVDRFRQELETRLGRRLDPPRTLAWNRADDYLGWHRQDSELWFVGIPVISGRLRDFPDGRALRTGIREIVSRFRTGVRLTAQQNLYLSDIPEAARPEVARLLQRHGLVEPEALPPVLRHAMSCPALPTCGLAITESERIMPGVVAELQQALDAEGLPDEVVHLRTTGCPNGCARPYTAEIGIVGASVDMYTIYLGGSPLGTRLGQPYARNVKRHELIERLRPVLLSYREERQPGERFGDFCHRTGVESLQRLQMPVSA